MLSNVWLDGEVKRHRKHGQNSSLRLTSIRQSNLTMELQLHLSQLDLGVDHLQDVGVVLTIQKSGASASIDKLNRIYRKNTVT